MKPLIMAVGLLAMLQAFERPAYSQSTTNPDTAAPRETRQSSPSSEFVLPDIKILPENATTEMTFTMSPSGALSVKGKMGTVPAKDFPQERIVLENMFHDGAVHHFAGHIEGRDIERMEHLKVGLEGYAFDGDREKPLTFRCASGKGYVYASGVGSVTLKNGTQVAIPPQGTPKAGLPSSTPSLPSSESKPAVAGPSARDPVQLVTDAAHLGIICTDLAYNLVGVGWEDRETLGAAGRDRMIKEAKRIGSKYGYEVGKFLPLVSEGGGTTKLVYLDVPNQWTGLTSFPSAKRSAADTNNLAVADGSEFPPADVQFRSGRIVLSFDKLAVSFSEGLEARVGSGLGLRASSHDDLLAKAVLEALEARAAIYRYTGGKWIIQSPAQAK